MRLQELCLLHIFPMAIAPVPHSIEHLLASCNDYALGEHGHFDSKKRMKACVSSMWDVLSALQPMIDSISSMIPGAGIAVGACTVIVRLEKMRKENSHHLVAVCNSMVNMVAALRYLDPKGLDYPDGLVYQIDQMARTIHDFGTFAETYNTRYARKVVRFLLARDINSQLHAHVKSFQEHREHILLFLSVHVDATSTKVFAATQRILSKLEQMERAAAPAAAEIVETLGGDVAVRNNPECVREVARALGDNGPLSPNVFKTLTTRIETLLEQHRSTFEAKLNSAKDEIVLRLTQGPHDLLVDDNVKEVWRVNGWRLCVKYRVFIDSLHAYFESTARRSAGPESGSTAASCEDWALKVLSKVINHVAIGEAIDEDASGFLSINEVNQFLRRKPGYCSTPAWFAFWAVGWRYMNILYSYDIKDMVPQVQDQCLALWQKSGPGFDAADDRAVQDYLAVLKKIELVNSWVDYVGGEPGEDVFDELDDDAKRVAQKLAKSTEATLRATLSHFDFMVDDLNHLLLIMHDATTRIEQVLMLLLTIILENHHAVLEAAKESGAPLAPILNHLGNSLEQILKEFGARTRSLIRSWRSQKLDLEVQVSCYAGGLLYGWYKNVMSSPSRVHTLDENPAAATRLQGIEERLSKMEERLSKMDNVLEQVARLLHGQRTVFHTSPSPPFNTPVSPNGSAHWH